MNVSNFKISKNRYLQIFGFSVILLALFRCANPKIAENPRQDRADSTLALDMPVDETINETPVIANETPSEKISNPLTTRFLDKDGNIIKHRIYSVPNYKEAFPDSNSVQMAAAKKWGVTPVVDREEAESRKMELVYVGSSPYFFVEQLSRSIPYLVPRAALLLHDIGRNFFDSLQIKGIPLHKPIVTSVTRSQHDVKKLRNYNRNATENSCHLYATTFDICYNRYKPVGRQVRNDSLKFVLSEVLRDLRRDGRCYVKYEVKQGCFHITVR